MAPPEGAPTFWGMDEAARIRIWGTAIPRKKETVVRYRIFDRAKISELISEYYVSMGMKEVRFVPSRVFTRFRRLGPYMPYADFLPYDNTQKIIAYLRHQNVQGL